MKQKDLEKKKNSLFFQMRESQERIYHIYNAIIVETAKANKQNLKMLATSTMFVDNINICIPKTQNNTSKKQNTSKSPMLIWMSFTIAWNTFSFQLTERKKLNYTKLVRTLTHISTGEVTVSLSLWI